MGQLRLPYFYPTLIGRHLHKGSQVSSMFLSAQQDKSHRHLLHLERGVLRDENQLSTKFTHIGLRQVE